MINSNQAALNAQRRLGQSTSSLQDSFTRLSSGLRINRASDDAAGLAISESLNVDTRVFSQGIRNLNDGLSVLTVADGAIEQLSNIVIRLQELAEQSANGTLDRMQREALDAEAQELSEEFFRISQSTQFNGRGILDGSLGELRLQGGYGTAGGITEGIGGMMGTGSFSTVSSYATEPFLSRSIAVGDLDNDGFFDIVTGGYSNASPIGYATVHLGKGDGSFTKDASYRTEPNRTYSTELEDLNADGVLDLITTGDDALNDQGYTTIRLGLGDGTFGEATSFLAEPEASVDLEVGDLDKDGNMDLVTLGYLGEVSVRLARGDGSFDAIVSYQGSEDSLTLGDVNGDGVSDLVMGGGFSPGGYIAIRYGVGDGTFSASYSYQTDGYESNGVDLGDVNGDGIVDLVTSGRGAGTPSQDAFVSVQLGKGDGTFATSVSYVANDRSSRELKLGDFNGDGALDVVSAGYDDSSLGQVSILLGNGDGSYQAAQSYDPQDNSLMDVALGDFNNDGVLDFVTASGANPGTAGVFLSETKEGVSPLLPFDLRTLAGARQTLPVFQRKLSQLAEQRGKIGAFQARVGVAINTLQVERENYNTARSQIVDADVAHESAKLVRNNILQQTGAAVLAQANQSPALALRLLGEM